MRSSNRVCSVSCLEDTLADLLWANVNVEDDDSRHVTFTDTNTSTSTGRVRKEERLCRRKKIVWPPSLVVFKSTDCETSKYAVNFLQCIFSALCSLRRDGKTRKGRDPEFNLNGKLRSAWGRHYSPVPIKLIECNWVGTCLADIDKKVHRFFFFSRWVEVGALRGSQREDTAAFT